MWENMVLVSPAGGLPWQPGLVTRVCQGDQGRVTRADMTQHPDNMTQHPQNAL